VSSYPGILPGWIIFSLDSPHPEPLSVIAGDSLKWSRIFDSYPASDGWALTYVLNNASNRYLVVAGDVTTDGNGWDIAIPSAETRLWAPGEYLWLAVLQNAGTGERITGAAGRVTVQGDILDATTPLDTRALEETALENIRAVLAGRAADGVLEYKIADRELRRYSMEELLKLEAYFVARVQLLRNKRGEYREPTTVAFYADWGNLG
jgi:hypothetical protein